VRRGKPEDVIAELVKTLAPDSTHAVAFHEEVRFISSFNSLNVFMLFHAQTVMRLRRTICHTIKLLINILRMHSIVGHWGLSVFLLVYMF